MESVIWGVIILSLSLLLITRRWFWVLVFFVGGLASLFSMVACIIHFQIVPAIGLFFLMAILFKIAGVIQYQ